MDDTDPTKWTETRIKSEVRKANKSLGRFYGETHYTIKKHSSSPVKHKKYRVPRLIDGVRKDP